MSDLGAIMTNDDDGCGCAGVLRVAFQPFPMEVSLPFLAHWAELIPAIPA